MLKQIEGSHAMAEAIALCRPEVICAYPITPQTHIVEGLGELVKKGACQSALEWDPLSASKRGSDSLLMQFGGCLAF